MAVFYVSPCDCRLPLLASYELGLLAVADLLGLSVGDVHEVLQQLQQRALARAGLTAEEVRVDTG